MTPEFTWSDAWVLAAVTVGGGNRGAALREIIEAGDLINRAILTPQELRRGLAKLVHAGHVAVDGDSFVITGRARLAHEFFSAKARSSYDLLQFFEDFLEALPYPAGDPRADDPLWTIEGITDERVAAACESYHNEFAELYKEATGDDLK